MPKKQCRTIELRLAEIPTAIRNSILTYRCHTLAILLPYLRVWLHYGISMATVWHLLAKCLAEAMECHGFCVSLRTGTTEDPSPSDQPLFNLKSDTNGKNQTNGIRPDDLWHRRRTYLREMQKRHLLRPFHPHDAGKGL